MLVTKLFARTGNPLYPDFTPVVVAEDVLAAHYGKLKQLSIQANCTPSGASFTIMVEARLTPDAAWVTIGAIADTDGASGSCMKELYAYPYLRVTHVASSLSVSPLTALSCWIGT